MANAFIETTNRNLFITGKAGTGKTTFLKNLPANITKKCIITAPTGIAAVNAKGTTLHSIFQTPPGYYLPVQTNSSSDIYTPDSILSNLNYSASKTDMLRQLEVLVIDEVSMVRCDHLDLIDAILKKVRKNNRPFGDVQIVLIGDLFQLPPVIKNDILKQFEKFYSSPYFFYALAVQHNPLLKIEFAEVFRQTDSRFISILNGIREGQVSEEMLTELNKRYFPTVTPNTVAKRVFITSHNAEANQINQNQMSLLPGKEYRLEGVIKGNFKEQNLPVDRDLIVKEGAQVMLIKNDTGESRNYYNGKIGTVDSIHDKQVVVRFADESSLGIEKAVWYSYDYQTLRSSNKPEPEQTGEYIQFPLRLAWASTIHKVQGLTFETAEIDAAESFAPGQVYVALSRVKSLEGLFLKSKLTRESIQTSTDIINYVKNVSDISELNRLLTEARTTYFFTCLLKSFSFGECIEQVEDVLGKPNTIQQKLGYDLINLYEDFYAKANALQKTVAAFQNEISGLTNLALIHKRLESANTYFQKKILDEFLNSAKQLLHIEEKKENIAGAGFLAKLQWVLEKQLLGMSRTVFSAARLCEGVPVTTLLKEQRNRIEPDLRDKELKEKDSKKQTVNKSLSQTILDVRNGITLPGIAKSRKLSLATVENHVLEAIQEGHLNVGQVIDEVKAKAVEKAIREVGMGVYDIKEKLGADYSFFEIKVVMAGNI